MLERLPLVWIMFTTDKWRKALSLSLPSSLQLNMVFDGMRATKDFNGYVVFLEEDHYLSPDFLYMTEKLIALKEEWVCVCVCLPSFPPLLLLSCFLTSIHACTICGFLMHWLSHSVSGIHSILLVCNHILSVYFLPTILVKIVLVTPAIVLHQSLFLFSPPHPGNAPTVTLSIWGCTLQSRGSAAWHTG